jgi:methylated-DNA-[protein]-cysteine S-methyltransferase
MPTTPAPRRSADRPTVIHDTALGPITLSASRWGLTRARFGRPAAAGRTAAHPGTPERDLLDQAVAEVEEYLAGRRTSFAVPIDLTSVATDHRRVLDVVCQVGYGETRSYAELARGAGLTEDGPRRAGAACARNPVLLFVPCHRIVATNGNLTGYAGGLSIKTALLALERGQFALPADLTAAAR